VVKSSGSGAPYFTKKAQLKEECRNILDSFLLENFDDTVFSMPNVIYRVCQPGKSGQYKGRLVYCPPFAITVLELIFGLSVTKHFVGSYDTSIIIGHRQIDLYNLNMAIKDKHKASGDYSSYDQTIPSFIIKICFEIIKNLYDFKSNYEEQMYDKLVSYVMHGHIYHPITGYIHRKRGIASGSVFTNLVDSMANLIIVNYSSVIMNKDLGRFLVCGDDNLISTSSVLNTSNLERIVSKVFNMSLTFDKDHMFQAGVPHSHFLGSYWSEDGPERDVKRMILSCIKYR